MTPGPEPERLALRIGERLFVLEPGRSYDVGASPACDLVLVHATVSQHHARIVGGPGGFVIEDLASTNGTVVDGARVERIALRPGQALRFGLVAVDVVDGGADAAAAPPRRPQRHLGTRLRDQTTFAELMALELRHAPWLTLSAIIHAILLLVLYVLFDETPLTHKPPGKLTLAEREQDAEVLDVETPPHEEIRVEDVAADEAFEEDPLAPLLDAPVERDTDVEFDVRPDPGRAGGDHWLLAVRKGGEGILGHAGVRGGGFGKTVGEIRRSGLEIVFVFDSTSSMQSVLQGAKDTIAETIELLHALVPDARIGIVTYRDRDPVEDYATRFVPLGVDLYRAINFMQVVSAAGGGDRPEAVLDGLDDAIEQRWDPKARRVVVLIGDAPAHQHDEREIQRLVSRFAANGRSFVHAIVTSPYRYERKDADTRESYRMIAERGGGECLDFEDQAHVMQQVLSLAFGRQYRTNLDTAQRIMAQETDRIATSALDAVRGESFDDLRAKLREEPVSDDVVKAMARSNSKAIARFLVDVLSSDDYPEPARHAAAWALRHVLQGRLAPAVAELLRSSFEETSRRDRAPWTLAPITKKAAAELQRLVESS